MRRARPPTRSLRPINPDNARGPRITAAAGTRFAAPYSSSTVNDAGRYSPHFPNIEASRELYDRSGLTLISTQINADFSASVPR